MGPAECWRAGTARSFGTVNARIRAVHDIRGPRVSLDNGEQALVKASVFVR